MAIYSHAAKRLFQNLRRGPIRREVVLIIRRFDSESRETVMCSAF